MKKELIDAILGEVQSIVATDTKVMHVPTLKNNGLVLNGLNFLKKGSCLISTFYIENYADEYTSFASYPMIARRIVDDYNDYMEKGFPTFTKNINVNGFFDFENIKDKITLRLINFERNKEMLKDVPHLRFLDLAIVFRINIDEHYSAKVDNGIFESFGILKEELLELAKENTRRFYPLISMPLSKMLRLPSLPDVGLWIITEKNNCWGASALLYEDALHEVADKFNDDIYILPSSVEEILAVPVSFYDVGSLRGMVNEVNENGLESDLFLSNQVYRYNRATRKVVIAKDRRFRVVS